MGFGCHWSVFKAVTSALLEINQILTVRSDAASEAAVCSGRIAVSQLKPSPDQASLCYQNYPYYASDWPSIQEVIDRLAKADLDVIIVDQTHPDIGVPVGRVIIPGMAHHWRRMGAKRLYSVPVDMKWQEEVPVESEMNPTDIVL